MRTLKLGIVFVLAFGCALPAPVEVDDEFAVAIGEAGAADTGGLSEGTPEAAAVLRVANELSGEALQYEAGLHAYAATRIVERRGSGYSNLAAVDAVPYVGPIAFEKMLTHAQAMGWIAAEVDPPSDPGEPPVVVLPVGHPETNCPDNTLWMIDASGEFWQERSAADAFRRVPEGGTILFCKGSFEVEKAANLVSRTTRNYTVRGISRNDSVLVVREQCDIEDGRQQEPTFRNLTVYGGWRCLHSNINIDGATFADDAILVYNAKTSNGAQVNYLDADVINASGTLFTGSVTLHYRNAGSRYDRYNRETPEAWKAHDPSFFNGCRFTTNSTALQWVHHQIAQRARIELDNCSFEGNALALQALNADTWREVLHWNHVYMRGGRIHNAGVGVKNSSRNSSIFFHWENVDFGRGTTDNNIDMQAVNGQLYSNYGANSSGDLTL